MDPITAPAIISAILTSVAASAAYDAGKTAVVNTFNSLKSLIRKKFGNDGKLPKAIEMLESDPNSPAAQLLIKEKAEEVKADEDHEIRALAQELIKKLQSIPEGEKHIQQAIGNNIAQADRNSIAKVIINSSRKE